MRQAKFKNPLTAYVSDMVYAAVKKITADKMINTVLPFLETAGSDEASFRKAFLAASEGSIR